MKIVSKIIATTVLIAAFSSAHAALATATACGSVSMTPNDGSTGAITCQAHGIGNVEIKANVGIVLKGSDVIDDGSLPTTSGEALAYVSGQGTDGDFSLSGGDFLIGDNVWNKWKSIYVTIKEASGNGNAGGGWAIFLVESVVSSGEYVTKLQSKAGSGFGISHFFVAGGEKLDVSEVPLPAAVWLFGSAFAGLMGVARKRTKVA